MAIKINHFKTRIARYPVLGLAALIAAVMTGVAFDFGKSDWSAWVQAVGSVAALGVAIFVMSRQNANAIHVILGAEKRALQRKALAVSAILSRANTQMESCASHFESTALTADQQKFKLATKMVSQVMSELRSALVQIPMHELGSHDLVAGLHQTINSLDLFDKSITMARDGQNSVQTMAAIPLQMVIVRKSMGKAAETFKRGLAEIDRLI